MLPFRLMLKRYQPSRRVFLTQTLSLATTAGLGIGSSGCASIIGVQDVEFNDIKVTREHPDSFYWWTEFSISYDTNSVDRATLISVTVDVTEPMGTGDLSFLQSATGTAAVGDVKTKVASCSKFPPGEQAVVFQVEYRGDLKPLFFKNKDGKDTIHIDWRGEFNPAFTNWPPQGFLLRARAKIDIE